MTISDPVAVEPEVRVPRNEPEVRLRRNTARAGRGDNLLSARAAPADDWGTPECGRSIPRRTPSG